jgi:phosphoribosylformylglycinamidine synthase subunit PurQ / glutaminase
MKPKALVLLAYGTNRDQDVAEALARCDADPVIVPLNSIHAGKTRWSDFQILVLPGGFSYADALGAGKLLAIDMQSYFADEIQGFVEEGKPVIGICNGFQALVKAGILPGKIREPKGENGEQRTESSDERATLTFNAHGHFECRWVSMRPVSQKCIWTKGLLDLIECPIAHGEGNFQVSGPSLLTRIGTQDQIALVYVRPDGTDANGEYPANPNGSMSDIAGVCNPAGNVLGLMPHPENHIHPWQHPQWTRGVKHNSGLSLFRNGVKYAEVG